MSQPADPPGAELKGKAYSVVATVIDNGSVDAAAKGVTDALGAHPEVKCVVGLFSYSGPAVVKGIDAAGDKDKVKVIGFDETAEEQAAVASGAIYSRLVTIMTADNIVALRARRVIRDVPAN